MRRVIGMAALLCGGFGSAGGCGGTPATGDGTVTTPEPQPQAAAPTGFGVASSADAVLRLEVRASRTTYAAGEPLELEAWLVNGGSGPAVVLARASHVDLGLDASNEAGEFVTSLLPPEPPPPPTREDLALLAAGAELQLRDWEMLQRVNEQLAAGNGRTGTFKVRAYYHAGTGLTENLLALDPAAWTGSVASEPLTIEIR
jgi:hypothetical protein